MTDESLTAELAERVLGWKATPNRFIKSGRTWIPRWRFAPLVCLDDAVQLLDTAASSYELVGENGAFAVEVRSGSRTGKASGKSKARVITIAVARSLDLPL